MNQIKNLSLFGICMAFVVIALGAWTRLVDAGLGCPDWPGCYGFVVFPINEAEIAIAESRYPTFPYDINKAIPEVVHRYFAAALGLEHKGGRATLASNDCCGLRSGSAAAQQWPSTENTVSPASVNRG